MRMCPPPSPARSHCIWTCLSVPAIPAPRAVWPTTGPKGHPSSWLVHPLSAHHHLPSPSGTPCMHALQIRPHFRIWMHLSVLASHLGGPFHHLSALVAPIFLWVGYLGTHHTLFPPFQLCAYMHTHSGQPSPHPGSMPTCAPFCAPPHTLHTIFSWVFLVAAVPSSWARYIWLMSKTERI